MILTIFISIVSANDDIYSAAWALKYLFNNYHKEVAIFDIEMSLREYEEKLALEDGIVALGRKFGLYLNRFMLADKRKDLLKINESFITKFKDRYCVIEIEKDSVNIVSNQQVNIISKKDFLVVWGGEFISVPIINVLLKRHLPAGSKGRIVFIYSYHNEEFYLFKDVFDKLYRSSIGVQDKVIYVDELGLIPQTSVEKLVQENKITEKEAFLKARQSLLVELKLIEKGIGIHDPTEYYNKIYSYLAKFKMGVDMEDLQYENWKAIIAFDDLNLNQLAVTLFCRGNTDRYLEAIKQYNQGFWEYNVIIRDKFFKNQIEEIAQKNPGSCIVTLRGLGHFGMEEDLVMPGFTTEVMIIGEESFSNLLVPDQFIQIAKRNEVILEPDIERISYLRAFIAECLRSYFQKRLNFKISEATVKANKVVNMLEEDQIYRISLDINHGIAEGRLRTTEAIYDYVFYWLRKKDLTRIPPDNSHSLAF
ncbi:MAG: hypothetical protein P9M06_01775 [Candidatus Saelkia tenebricola]|nr:hypothetical protein [Candidatus Saelkia tenebricola]